MEYEYGFDNLILLRGGLTKENHPEVFPGGENTSLDGYYRPPRIISFNQPDTIIPDPFNVLDFNRYGYARYNPLRYTDPSGHCAGSPNDPDNPDSECWERLAGLEKFYNVRIINSVLWTLEKLDWFRNALSNFRNEVGAAAFHKLYGQSFTIGKGFSGYKPGEPINIAVKDNEIDFGAAVYHELTHAILYITGTSGEKALRKFEKETKWTCSEDHPECNPGTGATPYSRNEQRDLYGVKLIVDAEEDLAESLAVYLAPTASINIYGLDLDRKNFIAGFLSDLKGLPSHRPSKRR